MEDHGVGLASVEFILRVVRVKHTEKHCNRPGPEGACIPSRLRGVQRFGNAVTVCVST